MTNGRTPPGKLPGRFPTTGPLRNKPQLPSELLDLTDEQYELQLRDFGFSERAIRQELETFRTYKADTVPPARPDPVAAGPTRGKIFDMWIKTRRQRRELEERVDDEEEDEETDEDPWGGVS